MIKRVNEVIAFCLVLSILFSLALVSAVGVTLSSGQVNIQNVNNLYAYEVDFDHSGTVTTVTGEDAQEGYLGTSADSQYGHNTRGTITSVYGSRLDNSAQGVSGNGNLFNITYTGTLSLRYALFVYANDTKEYVFYNNSAVVVTTTTTASSGGGGAYIPPNKTKITVVKDNNPSTTSPGMEPGLGGGGATTGKIISEIPELRAGNAVKSLVRSIIEFFIRLFGGSI